jgi:hypothetical protein
MLGAVCLISYSVLAFSGQDAVVLPIDVRSANPQSVEFTPIRCVRCVLYFGTYKPPSSHNAACLLGIWPADSVRCVQPRPVRIKWELLRDGRIVERGLSQEANETRWPARPIESLRLHRWDRYALQIVVLDDAPALVALHPYVSVTQSPLEVVGDIVLMALSLALGAVFFLTGFLWLIIPWVGRRIGS